LAQAAKSAAAKVQMHHFYQTFRGHDVELLGSVLNKLKQRHQSIVYFAGDSSLDNKYWIRGDVSAVNGYETALSPPKMKADVCYWMNHFLEKQNAADGAAASVAAINAAVEATTLRERMPGYTYGGLLEQDKFIQENIGEEDYLVVSVGGNDIALAPTPITIASMLAVVHGSTPEAILRGEAWGIQHFLNIYGWKLQNYIERLVANKKPKKVVVCMLYYPEVGGKGWADTALKALRYKDDPTVLQAAIAACFHHSVSKITVDGTEVVPVPLFEVLNGQNASDYVDRVEPSSEGGKKMAEAFMQALDSNPISSKVGEAAIAKKPKASLSDLIPPVPLPPGVVL